MADENYVLKRVISGGQTGIDRAGLEAAKICKIETGGKAPEGYKTEAGHDLSLSTIYGMTAPSGGTYVSRTIDNIKDSEGTLVFWAVSSAGTDGTISYCHTGKWNGNYILRETRTLAHNLKPCRPIFVISYPELQRHKGEDNWKQLAGQVVDFLKENNITILNVAGHRGSRCPQGFAAMVQEFLSKEVFSIVSNK